MLDFLAELLLEFILGPIVQLVFGAVWWTIRTGALLALYPLLLGWLRLWVRERGQVSLQLLWQQQGPAGLHRFGWAQAALDVEYLLAALLITLAAGGISLVAIGLCRLWSA
jgi:hypothetical protein